METVIPHKPVENTLRYTMRRTEETALCIGHSENALQMSFSLKYNGKRDGTDCYEYRVSEHSCTNHEGLHKWAEDLSALTEHLEIGISQGRLKRIFNSREIYVKWERPLWYETRKKHRKEENAKELLECIENVICDESRFVETLAYAPPFSLLFPGIHDGVFLDGKSQGRQSRILNFGGCPYLPIENHDSLEIKTDGYEVISEGKVDKNLFDEKIFANFVRMLSDDSMAIDELNTRHTERYDFDGRGCVRQAMCLHLSAVPDFMFREERVFLKQISS